MEKPQGPKGAGRALRTCLYNGGCRYGHLSFGPCDYGQKIDLCPGVQVCFNDMGHLLGSASIEVWVTEENVTKKIVFSGDVGNINQPIIRDPQPVKEADYVVIESTYGDRTTGRRFRIMWENLQGS